MNTPNKITLVRIFMIPIIVFFYLANFIPFGKIIALVLFIIASATDFLDGYLARKNNQVTTIGKFLDPIADKVLVLAGLLLLICDGTVPSPYGVIIGIIIIGRELIISAFRQIASSKNVIMAADKWGKIKTFVTDIALCSLIVLAHANQVGFTGDLMNVFKIFNWVAIGIATILTVISAINYIVKNKSVFK
ncbi:MAG: CDP-diacylglycerol--glycerol-3-phosphate 3-phosphatidyltransferase [Clostridia bacterium]